MNFYDENSNMIGYIAYITQGNLSHIIMDNQGVVYEVNPLLTNGSVNLFKSLIDATNVAKENNYTRVTAIKFIAIKCKFN